MDILYIVIPAYNESENILSCIDDWYPIIERYNADGKSRLVIIDDGSKDETLALLKKAAETRKYLVPLTKPNGGHGSTVLFGYRYSIENGADLIFQTDSDGQTSPDDFEAFWNERNIYDAVIGSRTSRDDGQFRKFIENTVCFLLRMYFGVKVPDANAPFRLMRASLISKYISKLPENYNLPNIMLTTYFVYNKERVEFLPITFKKRQGGKNSINIRKIVKIGWNALGDFRKFKKELNRK